MSAGSGTVGTVSSGSGSAASSISDSTLGLEFMSIIGIRLIGRNYAP